MSDRQRMRIDRAGHVYAGMLEPLPCLGEVDKYRPIHPDAPWRGIRYSTGRTMRGFTTRKAAAEWVAKGRTQS